MQGDHSALHFTEGESYPSHATARKSKNLDVSADVSPERPSGGGVSMPIGYPGFIEGPGRSMSVAPNMPDWQADRVRDAMSRLTARVMPLRSVEEEGKNLGVLWTLSLWFSRMRARRSGPMSFVCGSAGAVSFIGRGFGAVGGVLGLQRPIEDPGRYIVDRAGATNMPDWSRVRIHGPRDG